MPRKGRKTTKREVFEDPYKLKGRILTMIRQDFKVSPMYAAAKAKSFLGKTIYQCPLCGFKLYTGQSDKNFDKLSIEYEGLERGKESKHFDMDHIEPIVPYNTSTKEMTLDELAIRTYCHEDNLQYICKKCHKEKSNKEATLRKEERKK